MKSSRSNISNLNWSSQIGELYPKEPSKSALALISAGYSDLSSLLWLVPLRVIKMPVLKNFSHAKEDSIFTGIGKVISVRSLPSFNGRGKGMAQLLNITVVVQDIFSKSSLELKWFNSYSSVSHKIQSSKYLEFTGQVQSYQGALQVVNPDFKPYTQNELPSTEEKESQLPQLKVQYPTTNGVNSSNIKKVIEKIPLALWDNIEDTLPQEYINKRNLLDLKTSFAIIHAKREILDSWSELQYQQARDRLVYQELFEEQLKFTLRKKTIKSLPGINIKRDPASIEKILSLFPYSLTNDQECTYNDVLNDLESGHPMMRLVQGDVGCGKTTIAIIAGLIVCMQELQSALMCPTESLAIQHFKEIKEYCDQLDISCSLLIGSTPQKERKKILEELSNGKIKFIIGTHSLFQDTVVFKNLSIAIIDEQHKFGVEQRLKLVAKGSGCHCLIMTATPIPRSLCLTQFGDLDISTITTMPSGRKGSQTRIVTQENFGKFLNFISTRVSMNEQIYVVVPAITESPTQDTLNLEDVLKRFQLFYPKYSIAGIHGQMASEEKRSVLEKFNANEINILIATSVIEVGINVINATVMAILSPERFGLSSLHQLRGRVGRGSKPGFCFLVNEKNISSESMQRLRVIEKYSDGFHIAEEDLKLRGAGDIFGKEQSGSSNNKKIANIILNSRELEYAKEDSTKILKENPETLSKLLKRMEKDAKIFSTV
ncbi:ATP-dependent DNA helicase RecG [Halobacteriovorax sp. HLS]|uniref:ATP-dependent DNA helicase RecG n=1 Tax=Halobacteriovorax sp. HLS TaxID=2234000 RepID=UPI000FD91DDB|nr:ATP-dependent DNA helicase RecG [Halobacteriovorax sp. HLS]